jgi:NAD-dependent deacetylase sirtuin 2
MLYFLPSLLFLMPPRAISLSSDPQEQTKPTEKDIESFRPKPVDGLPALTLKGIADYIKSGRARRIIIACGAGISCAAGIPDFRTPGTGLYDNLQKYNLPYPEAIFDISYFPDHPEAFFSLTAEMLPGKFTPTVAHFFCAFLHRKALVLRVFTQNIDGLERLAGVPGEALVEAHGTYYTAHCLSCDRAYALDEIRATLEAGAVPRCSCTGLIKPDIVFFGEGLPDRFAECWASDLPQADLMIVMGTSLAVTPFANIIYAVGLNVPRLLVNREAVAVGDERLVFVDGQLRDLSDPGKLFKFNHIFNRRDVFAGGDCQETVMQLVRLLGWEDEFLATLPPSVRETIAPPDPPSSPDVDKE